MIETLRGIIIGFLTLGIAVFLWVWLIPYISNKLFYRKLKRIINKIEKKQPEGETKEQLKEVSKLISEIDKQEKLYDDED